MEGVPTYTQHTIAFPRVSMHQPGVVEDINIGFDAFGGGTHGEFSVQWYRFNTRGVFGERLRDEPDSFHVEFFKDGMSAFFEPRVQAVMEKVRRMRTNPTPEQFKDLLEGQGIKPSRHHLSGLIESGELTYAEECEAKSEIARHLKRERGER